MVTTRSSGKTKISFTGFSTSNASHRNHLEGDRAYDTFMR
ncbi:hypothetical protein C4J84_0006 [Pseudomonas sp. R11-23-07]|nr:hypothetical protein C4J84_0006 [Pseudomonas sp. R11-23-07]